MLKPYFRPKNEFGRVDPFFDIPYAIVMNMVRELCLEGTISSVFISVLRPIDATMNFYTRLENIVGNEISFETLYYVQVCNQGAKAEDGTVPMVADVCVYSITANDKEMAQIKVLVSNVPIDQVFICINC